MQSLSHDLFFAYFLEFVPLELALLARSSTAWHSALLPLLNKCRERDCRIVATPWMYSRHFQKGFHPPRYWPERNPLPELPIGNFGFKRCGEPAWFYQGTIARTYAFVLVFYASDDCYKDVVHDVVQWTADRSPRDALYEWIKSL